MCIKYVGFTSYLLFLQTCSGIALVILSNVNCIFGWLSLTEVLLLVVGMVFFREKVSASPLPEVRLDIDIIAPVHSYIIYDVMYQSVLDARK